jgi:hypothetical protein
MEVERSLCAALRCAGMNFNNLSRCLSHSSSVCPNWSLCVSRDVAKCRPASRVRHVLDEKELSGLKRKVVCARPGFARAAIKGITKESQMLLPAQALMPSVTRTPLPTHYDICTGLAETPSLERASPTEAFRILLANRRAKVQLQRTMTKVFKKLSTKFTDTP